MLDYGPAEWCFVFNLGATSFIWEWRCQKYSWSRKGSGLWSKLSVGLGDFCCIWRALWILQVVLRWQGCSHSGGEQCSVGSALLSCCGLGWLVGLGSWSRLAQVLATSECLTDSRGGGWQAGWSSDWESSLQGSGSVSVWIGWGVLLEVTGQAPAFTDQHPYLWLFIVKKCT